MFDLVKLSLVLTSDCRLADTCCLLAGRSLVLCSHSRPCHHCRAVGLWDTSHPLVKTMLLASFLCSFGIYYLNDHASFSVISLRTFGLFGDAFHGGTALVVKLLTNSLSFVVAKWFTDGRTAKYDS